MFDISAPEYFRWILNVHICYGHLENKIYKVYNYMFLNTTVLICMNNKILHSRFLLFLKLWFWLPWNVNKHIHFLLPSSSFAAISLRFLALFGTIFSKAESDPTKISIFFTYHTCQYYIINI